MEIASIDHIVLTAKNLEACIQFYESVLNMKHEITNGRHFLRFGSQKINLHTCVGEFQPAATCPTHGSLDFCLIAQGDIFKIKKEIEDKGYRIIEGVVPKNGAMGDMDSIYLYDPDGNLVEIAVYK